MRTAADVVTALSGARRAVQLYPVSHPAYGEALDALLTAVAEAASAAALVLNWHQGRLYHESLVIPDETHGAAGVAEAFETRSIESLTFHPGFSADDALGLVEVLSLRPTPDLDIEAELTSRDVRGVTVSVLEDEKDPEREERDRQRQADRAMYQRAIAGLRKLQEQLGAGDGDLAEAGGFVSGIMARLLADPSAVLGLATIRGTSEANLFHSMNVMIYTLALGQRLGLPDEGLCSLGMSALLHDIGKGAFIADDPAQAEPMRLMHPRTGGEILELVALHEPAPMLVAYEHHMGSDGSGWPDRDADYVTHPYSRMVAVANRYDNLVSPGPGGLPMTPDRALVQVLREGTTSLDPFFSRLFANALGAFPVGCLVRLSDHSVGVVSGAGEDPLAPRVRLAYDSSGNELTDPEELDLAEGDIRIVEVIHPDDLRVSVADKL